MSSLVISGDTSGSVTLQAPAVSGSTVLTLPATSGTVLTTASGTAATATNLAGGSNGTIPYQSSAGTTQMLAAGTAGQLLQTNGAGAPTWITPSAGALTLISTTTASDSATVDVENAFSTYDAYVLVITDLSAVQNDLRCRFKVGGTYLTTTTYRMGRRMMTYANDTYSAQNQNNTTNYIDVYGNVPDNASGRAMGVVWINGTVFTNASFTNNVYGTWMNSAVNRADNIFGESTAGACTGLRFFMATGNIATGKFRLYGLANS